MLLYLLLSTNALTAKPKVNTLNQGTLLDHNTTGVL